MSAQEASNALGVIFMTVLAHFEVSVSEPWWRLESCLKLEPARATKRRREMSYAYNTAVVKAVADSAAPVLVRQYLGAHSILRCSNEDQTSDCSGMARRITKDAVLRELAAARMVFDDPIMIHLTLDGVTAAGEHTNIFVAWLPHLNLAYIPPGQAQFRPTRSQSKKDVFLQKRPRHVWG